MSATVPRRPFLTSRQVGMAAAIGGLGFAWRALGFIIPLYPPFVLDIRESIQVIAAFAGGPYVAIVTGFLMGLPSALPMLDPWYYPLLGLFVCAVAKTVWKHRGLKGYTLLTITVFIAEAVALTLYIAAMAFVLGIVPFWPHWIASFSATYWIYSLQEIIPLIIVIRLFPDFMNPRWLWRGGEAIE